MSSYQPDGPSFESEGDLSIERLYRELMQRCQTDDGAAEPGPCQRSERLVTSVIDQLFTGTHFRFDEEHVKVNLDEVLVLLVALRDRETHGKGLMEDLARLFDARLSPGTVYPRLHDLEAEGILEMQELVRTKEYRIHDTDEARSMVEYAMRQHLALGFLFYTALYEL